MFTRFLCFNSRILFYFRPKAKPSPVKKLLQVDAGFKQTHPAVRVPAEDSVAQAAAEAGILMEQSALGGTGAAVDPLPADGAPPADSDGDEVDRLVAWLDSLDTAPAARPGNEKSLRFKTALPHLARPTKESRT